MASGGDGVTDTATGAPIPRVEYAALSYRCPHCNDDRVVMVRPHQSPGQSSWAWDGNKEMPTLEPSIQHRGGCQWHGFLIAGEWCDANKVPIA